MKHSLRLPLLASLAFVHTATAQDIIKAANKTALNLPGSWSGAALPGVGSTAVWNGTSTTAFINTAPLGANLTWQGIRIDDGYTGTIAKFTITGSETLTLGSAGIGVAVLSLEFGHPVTFSSDAPLRLNSDSKGITFNGPTNLGGHTFTVVSTSHTRFLAGSGGLSDGTLRHTTGQSQFNAASTGTFNLLGTGNAQIMVNHAAASNPQLNVDLTDTSKLSLGKAFDNLTFEIGNLSGTAGTWITPDCLQATGSPVVVRTLSVNQTTDGIFSGLLSDSNNNRDLGLIKNGSATLTLTNPVNEYSGPTAINAGTLQITGAGRLNHRPVPTQPIIEGIYPGAITNNATLHFDSTATQTLSGAMTGSGTLLKSNTGFLTLTGDGSGFTGGTLVNNGRLILGGSLAGSVSLASNTSLGGTGTSTGGLTTAAGSSLILAGGATTSALSFHGATINGPTCVEFASPQSNAVVYDVLSYGAGGLAGYENIVPLARGSLSHDVANKKVVFTALAPGTRTWNIGDGVWNSAAVLENWAQGDRVFYQGDAVVFDAMATESTFTGNVVIEGGRVVLGKETAIGYGNSGAKSVIITGTGQLDLNYYADTQHKEVKKPWLTYTFRIAGDGDGTGAITNTRGASLHTAIKEFDVAGVVSLELLGDASIGGSVGYDVGYSQNVGGVITGNGHTLTKRGPNTIHLRAAASNIPLVVDQGILGIEDNNNAFGGASGSVTVNANGSVGVSGPVVVPTPITLQPGATLRTIANWYGPFTEGLGTWSGPVTLLGIATVLTDPVAEDFIISGTIGGSGGIVKTGPQILTLTAANTYTGSTTVSQGTVIIQQPYLEPVPKIGFLKNGPCACADGCFSR